MSTLIAGPWLGEFGWELMMWHGRIRYLAQNGKYSSVVCITRTGHDFLYKDFSTKVIFLDLEGERNGYWLNGKLNKVPIDILQEHEDDVVNIIEPGETFNFKEQKFIKFSNSKYSGKKYDLIFHCRSTEKANTSYRNWETWKWGILRDKFSSLNIACVGSFLESSHIEGTDDLRGISLEDLCGVLTNSKMIIGPSSGTMHYASLCGCKHVVFTDKRLFFEGNRDNRYRYEVGWNPLGTKAIVIDSEGWKPSVESVLKCIEGELK